jgi:Putative Flp pilus-assembly TadE/G-like
MTKSNSRGDLRRKQRGQVLVLFALSLTFLVGIAGLAIEGGLLQADRRFDQDISDGAALAGAHKLPGDTTGALTQAAHYAVAALNGGQIPSDCNMATLAVDTPSGPGVALPTGCDPSPSHSLQIHTNYNGRPDQILVRLDHRGITLNLAAVVGAGPGTTASRSAARSSSAGTPFGFGVYVRGNLHTVGNTTTTVLGNVYVRGCIENNNQDNIAVKPSTDGSQVGSVEVYGDPNVPGVGSMPQVWTGGAGSGCNAFVDGSTGPSQWGASGHAPGACAPASTGPGPTAGFNLGVCPGGEVPLIGFPTFTPHDSTGCPNAPGTFTTTGGTAAMGCYSACAAGGGNVIVPSGTVFSPGTYAFVGNGAAGGCDVMLAGDASSAPTGGDGFGGVTFYLYNGASMCSGKSHCGLANSSGTAITLNAPNVQSPDDKNFGMLVYSCNGTCGNASGILDIEGPALGVNLTGTVYNPAGDCIVHSNAGQGLLGQLTCDNVTLQGGSVGGEPLSVSGYTGVEATPNFLAQLIE